MNIWVATSTILFSFLLGPAVQKTQAGEFRTAEYQSGQSLRYSFFGEDSRQPVRSDILPYSAVVRIHIKDKSGKNFQCNGVIVEGYYVLTAAHCIRGDADDIKIFTADGKEYAAASYSINPDYEPGNRQCLEMIPEDVAFIKTTDQIGTNGHLNISDFLRGDRKAKLLLAAYHPDNWNQLKHETCRASVNWWMFLDRAMYKCDIVGGSSGAPLLAQQPSTGKWYVIGLNVGNRSDKYNVGFMVGGHKGAWKFINSHVDIE